MPQLSASPAVEFDLGVVAQARLQGQLHLVEAPGHGWLQPVSSPAEISKAEQECIAWASELGLVQPGTAYFHKFCKSRLAALAACTLPDVPVHRATWFISLQAFIFTLDDALDNLVDLRAGAQYLPYRELREVFSLFMDTLTGQVPRALRGSAAHFPLLEAFHAVLRDIRERALHEERDLSWFLSSMGDYFEALAWEHGSHTVEDYEPTVSTYMFNREQTISYIQSIESFLVIKGISLSREHRLLHPVRLLLLSACRHVILVNDIFSLAKELACGELDNLLLLGPGKDQAVMGRRFKTLLDRLNALAVDIAHIAIKLLEARPGDRNLLGYVSTILRSVNGHISWYSQSQRYGGFVRPPGAGTFDARAVVS